MPTFHISLVSLSFSWCTCDTFRGGSPRSEIRHFLFLFGQDFFQYCRTWLEVNNAINSSSIMPHIKVLIPWVQCAPFTVLFVVPNPRRSSNLHCLVMHAQPPLVSLKTPKQQPVRLQVFFLRRLIIMIEHLPTYFT